jgi:hypothetical protein
MFIPDNRKKFHPKNVYKLSKLWDRDPGSTVRDPGGQKGHRIRMVLYCICHTLRMWDPRAGSLYAGMSPPTGRGRLSCYTNATGREATSSGGPYVWFIDCALLMLWMHISLISWLSYYQLWSRLDLVNWLIYSWFFIEKISCEASARRKIILMEGNAKCHHFKSCLRPRTPFPPPYKSVHVTNWLILPGTNFTFKAH